MTIGSRIDRSALRCVMITSTEGDRQAVLQAAENAIAAGVRMIQVREPGLDARELMQWGAALRQLAGNVDLKLLINSRVDLASLDLFDGVHLGWRAVDPSIARELLGPSKWIGVSIHSMQEAQDHARLSACDYAQFGPIFPTPSKRGWIEPQGTDRLRDIAAHCGIPIVAVGGITPNRCAELKGLSIAGVAAIRAFLDPTVGAALARQSFGACA